MPINSKNKYHLPQLTLVPNNTPRVELQTASAEFIDLNNPFSTSDYYRRETHNAFRGKRMCFPRLQNKIHEEFPVETDLVHRCCPLVAATKHKVSAPFTEGLSSLSAREKPAYTIQRTDILSSNLPQTVKLSQERNKTYFSVQINKANEEKRSIIITKPKRVEKVDKTIIESREIPPSLSFAPDELDNLKHVKKEKISRPTERPLTPYYPRNKQPKWYDVIPKIVCVGESLHDQLLQNMNSNDFFCQTGRPYCKKPLDSRLNSDPKTSPNVHKDIPNINSSKSTKKVPIVKSNGSVKLRNSSDTIFDQKPLNATQDFTLQTFSFVVKMPSTNGLRALSKPSCPNPGKNGGISPWCSRYSPSQSCTLYERNPIYPVVTTSPCFSQDFVTNLLENNSKTHVPREQCLPPEVDVIEKNENFRQVTTQMYPKSI